MERLWGIKETAEFLGIAPATLREWVSLRKLPFIKLGKRVLFDPADIREFIEKNKIEERQRYEKN